MKADFQRNYTVAFRVTKAEKRELERIVRAGKYRDVSDLMRRLLSKFTGKERT